MIRRARIRVFFVVGSLEVGGTELQIVELCRRLDPERFAPEVVTLGPSGVMAPGVNEIGIPVHAFRGEVRSTISVGGPRRALSGLRAVVRLRALMRRRRPDILHAFLAESCAVAAAAIGGSISPPLIVAKRSLVRSIRTAPFLPLLTRFANWRARVIHVNSEAVARSVGDVEGARSSKVRVIYNGVDTQRFRPPEAPLDRSRARIGMLANFRSYKGHLDVLDAFDALSRDFPAAELWLWGSDGPSGYDVRELCRVRGLEDRVRLLGVARDPAAALRQMDVFVSASHEEGFSNSVLEAMAAGLPIVGTSVGGTVEQIEHGATGLLVRPRDPGALSGALRAVLSDDGLASRLGSTARRRAVDRFSVERMVCEIAALYDELV